MTLPSASLPLRSGSGSRRCSCRKFCAVVGAFAPLDVVPTLGTSPMGCKADGAPAAECTSLSVAGQVQIRGLDPLRSPPLKPSSQGGP